MSIFYTIRGFSAIYEANTVEAMARVYVRYGTNNITIKAMGG
jgi:hypothetical protein